MLVIQAGLGAIMNVELIYRNSGVFLILLAVLGACATTAASGTEALGMSTDLTRQTVASAVCTRGNNPVNMTVAPDGTATGRVVGSRRTFSGSMRATGPGSVEFIIDQGAINGQQLSEVMQPVQAGSSAMLKGTTFECKDVRVRTPV